MATAAPKSALIVMMLCSPAFAHGQGRASSADNELLMAGEQTVVTATKKEQRVSDVPSAVTVITSEQIEASGALTLPDLLRYAPGVDVTQQNGNAYNVSIRGFDSQLANKLLVMVDGHSIYEDFLGIVSWTTNPILISKIKRIEIVRGPGSALYGANAFSGVINIITKTPAELTAERSRVQTRTLVGERNTQQIELLASAGSPKGWSVAVGGAYNHSDGYGSRTPLGVFDRTFVPVVTLDLQRTLRRGSLRITLDDAESVWDDYESIYLRDTHTHNNDVSVSYSEDQVKDPITLRMTGRFRKDTSGGVNYGDTQTFEAELQQTRALSARNSLVFGGSYRAVAFSSAITGPGTYDENLVGLYLQDEWRMAAPTSLFAGLRLDNNSIYGAQFTPRISLVHHLPARQSLRFSYGTAFRAPTLLDSYWQETLAYSPALSYQIVGNRRLKPEQLTSYELGYRKEWGRGYFAANAYLNRGSNLLGTVPVAFLPSPPAPPNLPSILTRLNSGSATVSGFELEAEGALTRHVKGVFNYAYEDQHSDNNQVLQLFSPKHKVNVSVEAQLSPPWDLFVGAHFVGAETIVGSISGKGVDPYTRFDARLGYRLRGGARPWTLSLGAVNLFDDRHLEFPVTTAPGAPLDVTPHRRTLYFRIDGKF